MKESSQNTRKYPGKKSKTKKLSLWAVSTHLTQFQKRSSNIIKKVIPTVLK